MACVALHSLLPTWKRRPSNLFDWNKKSNSSDEKRPQQKYHDIDLTFPQSLLSTTFLQGNFSTSVSPKTVDTTPVCVNRPSI